MKTKRFWVLEGYGIECEKETKRFLNSLESVHEVKSLFLPELLIQPEENQVKAGDWIFFPGGFSFSDHFESGTLLAFELRKSGLLKQWLDLGVHLFGVCNGFQILTKLELFGSETRLLHNQVNGRGLGFINRWIDLEYSFAQPNAQMSDATKKFQFPVRHGEGRLTAPNLDYLKSQGAEVLLRYNDPEFKNGSLDAIAGLVVKHKNSWIVGMMPHPEIVVRENQGPFHFAGEAMPQHREIEQQKIGAGQRFFNQLFADLEGRKS